MLRLAYWGPLAKYYEAHGADEGFCTGPVDPRVVMDYR